MALTKKLLSLGLVARLRPRRMLSFRSDTLDRVTLPEMGEGEAQPVAPYPLPNPDPESAAAAGHWRCLWQGWCQVSPPCFSPHVNADHPGLLRPCSDMV